MVRITPSLDFIKETKKLDQFQKDKLEKQTKKIIQHFNVAKPLKYRRGERMLYVKPFRLIYAARGDEIILLKFEHRKKVYKR